MKFEDLAMQTGHSPIEQDYLLVYHSNEGYATDVKRGELYTQHKGTFRIKSTGVPSVLLWLDDRLVVTTKMKSSRRDPRWKKLSKYTYVKCIYPMIENSPYYTNEDLFEAKLSGDYSKILKKIRKPFMKWKKDN